jgi:hypothetical protein
MPIASVSLGSFAVAVVALFSAGVQLFFALRIPSYRWGAWAFGVGLATAIYAFSVFLQFNAETLETHGFFSRGLFISSRLSVRWVSPSFFSRLSPRYSFFYDS